MAVSGVGAASAQPYRAYPASACLSGDAGPFDLVWRGDRPGIGRLELFCGLPGGTGVLHIDEGHAIAEDGSDDTFLRQCAGNILRWGEPAQANRPSHRSLRISRVDGGSAQIVWEEGTGRVVTMFTSDSNNWQACAQFAVAS